MRLNMLTSMLHILRISWVCNYIYGVLKPYLPNNPNTKPLLMPDSPVPPHFPSPPPPSHSRGRLARPQLARPARPPHPIACPSRLAHLLGCHSRPHSARRVRGTRRGRSGRVGRSILIGGSGRGGSRPRPGRVTTSAGEVNDRARGGLRPRQGRVAAAAGEGHDRVRGGLRPRPGMLTTAPGQGCDRVHRALPETSTVGHKRSTTLKNSLPGDPGGHLSLRGHPGRVATALPTAPP